MCAIVHGVPVQLAAFSQVVVPGQIRTEYGPLPPPAAAVALIVSGAYPTEVLRLRLTVRALAGDTDAAIDLPDAGNDSAGPKTWSGEANANTPAGWRNATNEPIRTRPRRTPSPRTLRDC